MDIKLGSAVMYFLVREDGKWSVLHTQDRLGASVA